jgi:hypothetical protein
MSHGYDHILELELEEKEEKLNQIAAEILRDNISLGEIDDIIWLWENRKKIRMHRRRVDEILV